MHNLISRYLYAGGLLGLAMILAGCQSYSSKPLELGVHRQSWLDRSPSQESVRRFADRIAESGDADAMGYNPDDGLSMAEGELVALVYNPDLRIARLQIGIAGAHAQYAGQWMDPEFSLDFLSSSENGSNPLVISAGLGITIPISGRLGVEKDQANAALSVEYKRVIEEEWRVRRDVQRVWMSWSAAHTRVAESERFIASMDSLVGSILKLADAGEMPRTEASLFVIEQAMQRLDLNRFRGEMTELSQEIRMLLGLPPELHIDFVPDLNVDILSALSNADRGALEILNPTLARLRMQYEVAELRLKREIKKQIPDLTIGPLYESDDGQSQIGLTGAIPLPFLNANRQGIAEARADRELARAKFETEFVRLAGSLAAARLKAQTVRAQHEEMIDEMIPLVDNQLENAQRLLKLGEGGGLVLLESLVRSQETKMKLIDIRLDEAVVASELAYLVGPKQNQPPQHSNTEVTP